MIRTIKTFNPNITKKREKISNKSQQRKNKNVNLLLLLSREWTEKMSQLSIEVHNEHERLGIIVRNGKKRLALDQNEKFYFSSQFSSWECKAAFSQSCGEKHNNHFQNIPKSKHMIL
ncbi:CLUMA_CG017105, isoform A [Clunio marinus]|uniref:CLUMA_CG017105, isoform A n=1 Tax=Clunio marinus TaxID=568069 RepID=A0A1J1IWA8_9DIPT|nr:CLUMA_CG017105, isoform A [Clunio marinus]